MKSGSMGPMEVMVTMEEPTKSEKLTEPLITVGKKIIAFVKDLQPQIKIFSDAGPDVHWIGNEKGFAGATFWSTINTDKLTIGASKTDYLNSGDPEGTQWIVGQCDVSIRPGWFYHSDQDSLVKNPTAIG